MLVFSSRGIYCPVADLYIDPLFPVQRAVITHAHSDHARSGHTSYLTHRHSAAILRHRFGRRASIQDIDYGVTIEQNGVRISLHPAGHVIGSAQVRLEYRGEVWCVSGDYKLEDDGVSQPFEPVQCNVFVTESTFGLPVYKWPEQNATYDEINTWWKENQLQEKISVLGCYPLGKTQRVLAHLDQSIGPIFAHEAVGNITRILLENGIALPALPVLTETTPIDDLRRSIVIIPPSAANVSSFMKSNPYSLGFASGWMITKGSRMQRGGGRGFVLSDHADWNGLNAAVKATGAEKIFVTHGYIRQFARWLRENGYHATGVGAEPYEESAGESPTES